MQLRRASTVALVGTFALAAAACSAESSRTTAGTAPRSSTAAAGCHSGVVLDEPLLAAPINTDPQQAFYSNDPVSSQAKDCDGMRHYLATPQPGWDLQSYVFYGHVKDSKGQVIAFSVVTQRNSLQEGTAPKGNLQQTGVIVNPGTGVVTGGVVGAADEGNALSLTSNPFSARSESTPAGKAPQYVDARVVEGQFGQPGAVIQLTAQIEGIDMVTPSASAPLQISVQVKDVGGIGQWGYGPSGFFPQWLHPNQREAVTNDYHGSVADYLASGKDPMTGQGDYYYSSPVVEVQSFTITQNGQVTHRGSEGELLIDSVNQSFDAKAKAIVGNGVQWTEFSTLLDGGMTMKVGEVTQSSVGTLPYAMLLRGDGPRLQNGSLDAERWDLDGLQLTPDPGSTWTSPRTKLQYATKYTAKLSGDDPSKNGELVYEAAFEDQEISIGGRSVYEGIYKVSGALGGKPVSGYAWAEIQPSGTL